MECLLEDIYISYISLQSVWEVSVLAELAT